MIRFASVVLCLCGTFQIVLSDAAINQDSYLNALQTSHHENSVGREDFDYHQDVHPGYDYQPAPIQQHYAPSAPAYGPPAPAYGPPAPIYGPPRPIYGPPAPIYGPPHHPAPYYHPRETWFWDKFKFKIDLFTIGKILLKLIIFKKIVKFIALIFLLLFLPKLHSLKDDDDSGSGSMEITRSFTEQAKLNNRINEVTNFALTAFETFSRKYEGCEREQIWCRFERMFDTVDANYPYEKIVKLYLPDADIKTNEVTTNGN